MDLTENIAKQINMLYSKKYDPDIFSFEMLRGPDIYQMLPYNVVEHIHRYILDPRNSGDTNKKINHIDDVLRPYGFKRFAGGTNRVVYGFLEDQSFCLKVAIDRTGFTNNSDEFKNQQFLKPFVCKIFSVSHCGTMAIVERVIPIRSRQEFAVNAGSIFDVIANKFVGKYILEDIGTIWFKNWGIRRGFGPVLLDYPYLYEVDLNSLFCNEMTPLGLPCGGQIDYDDGFNILYCTRCGKRHKAKQIGKAISENIIMIKGGNSMDFKLIVKKGDEVIVDKTASDTHIDPSKITQPAQERTGGGSWKKEDFDLILVLNGVKIGKKDGKTTILGESKAKATKLPSKDENPYKGFRTNVKQDRQPRNMQTIPEAPAWAQEDTEHPANRPGEKVVKAINMSGFGSLVKTVRDETKSFSLKVHLPETNQDTVDKQETTENLSDMVSENNSEEDTSMNNETNNTPIFDSQEEKDDYDAFSEEDAKIADELVFGTTDPDEIDKIVNSHPNSEQTVQENDPIDHSEDQNTNNPVSDDDLTEEENAKVLEETRKLKAKMYAKKIKARNKIAESYGFIEEDFDRTEDICDEEDSSDPDVSEY